MASYNVLLTTSASRQLRNLDSAVRKRVTDRIDDLKENPFSHGAIQLQGHAGKIIECNTCHFAGTLPLSLGGPHGLHPIEARWVGGHEDFLESHSKTTCQTCHGLKGEGTVLAKAAAARSFSVEDGTAKIAKGQLVGCGLCHDNPLGN